MVEGHCEVNGVMLEGAVTTAMPWCSPHIRHTGPRDTSKCSLVLTNQTCDNLLRSNDYFTAPVFCSFSVGFVSLDDLVVTILGLQVVFF